MSWSYEAQWEADERRADAISERAGELMDGDCNPSDTDNIAEALKNASDEKKKELFELMESTASNFEEIGRLVWNISFGYWEAKADEQAGDEIDNPDDGCEPYDDDWTAEHKKIANWSPRGW